MAVSVAQQHRGRLHLEEAGVLAVESFPGDQFIIRLHAPKCAAHATAGSFVHIQCDESIPMRRPLSIMRANPRDGWIEILFKIVGAGLHALGSREPGDTVSIIGPIGHGFQPSPERPNKLLIGGGVGIPPMIFLAEGLREKNVASRPFVIMGSEIPFPFELAKSKLDTGWLPDDIDSTMPLLEDWQIPARLASRSDFEGCYKGYVTDLAREWLNSLSAHELAKCEVFTCGPTPMLKTVTRLANEFDLPCQVSLEEYMACAVGGCAGCTVLVDTHDGLAMKRVCVDGPVFDGTAVFHADGA